MKGLRTVCGGQPLTFAAVTGLSRRDVVHRMWTGDFVRERGYLRHVEAADIAGIEVRRSTRRRRTVTAYKEGGRTIVLIPARFTRAQEREWVARMVERLSAQDRRRRPGDEELLARALDLSRRYLSGKAQPVSVAWSAGQNSRWGSCTPSDGTIRISTRLQGMPTWVIDYVILHELAHLLVAGHGPRFWAQLASYPRTERARGFLDGFAAAQRLADPDAGPDCSPDADTGGESELDDDLHATDEPNLLTGKPARPPAP